ncbi:tRNA lysidine(34) synthetase TilS [Antarcticibacterium sp. 1MA-6-2]|uniref:tRNA lysidine(34) synthetase TilS n=1 Tax=Antarcticibacterium sp. 1MA-6-2 TaxID=2908210 RepID=UPI001F25E0F5|nr:tRNA lysidine(34) synthetase TilS [Antarcticibacterium sp. 1MA-6-2]UJH92208.1 tRNA lysidine(34) synthetase TilS [Antarcticibacterium sp. 1MA-6-2]
MEKEFKNIIKSDFKDLSNSKLLLAVSGGVDSVVLAHLCKTSHLNFSIAHCNFNLRGEESDADEEFVVDLADALEVEVFSQRFDTEAYAEEMGVSIQMAARDLRYEWFSQLRSTLNFDYILTAHHANDNLETFLINLVRGSGLEGFTSIKAENNYIVRPLLKFSRKEIEAFAKSNNISWREDSTNASSKYLRNKIRHEVVPVLEEMNPQLLDSFAQTQEHLKESFDLLEDYIGLLYNEIVTKSNFGYELKIPVLQRIPNRKAVLYHLLKSFGFTEWNDVYDLLSAQPGKMVFSNTHRLIKDREVLILTEKPSANKGTRYEIPEGEEIVMLPPGTFTLHEAEEIQETTPNIIYVAKEKIQFPLVLRRWEKGDFFYPFGMKGKKKISDFFKDKKLSLPEKEESWLLCSGEKILWVVNHRADGRFAITDPSQEILKITYSL